MMAMRILLLGDYPADPRLGSTKVLVKLQEEFRALGHDCDLLLGDALGTDRSNRYVRQAIAPVKAWSAVRRAFRKGAYDVIDAASAEALWIARCRALRWPRAAVIARSNGLEHLNYQRMLDDHDAGLLAKPWTRRIFHPVVRLSQVAAAARAADRLVLLSEADRAYVRARRWKRDEEIDVIPHGVSARFLADAPNASANRGGGILFCGSWTEVKGVSYLVDAFSRLARSGSRATLTVLGGGVSESAIRAAFDADVRPLVTVLERAPEGGVMEAYRSHDVLAFCSTYEGFGMVLVEAMSQRLPVVATPVGCATALVRHRQTGLLVPPRNPAALADALAEMLRDPQLRRGCADGAFDRVRGMSWTATAERTLEAYQHARARRADAN
jgi:glycosyltransferase involved in cell wall biosynthesis